MDLYLAILVICSGILALRMAQDTRGVCYFSGGLSTDNEKMVRLANEAKLWPWPSSMHDQTYSRGQLREYWVLGLAVMKHFIKDKRSDHLNIVLSVWAHAACVVVLYLVLRAWFSPAAAFAAALLYMTSIWPTQVAIYMGHVHLAQLFFLLSVLFLQFSDGGSGVFLFLAGACAATAFASSSASRKYIPLNFVAFCYAQRGALKSLAQIKDGIFTGGLLALGLVVAAVMAGGFILKAQRLCLAHLLKAVARKDWALDKYAGIAVTLGQAGLKWAGMGLAFHVLCVASFSFYTACALFGLGIVAVAVHLLMPLKNFLKNAYRYYIFLNIGVWANHFDSYPDQERVFGRKLPKGFRGEGWPWIPRFLARVIPHVQLFYVLSAVGLLFFIPLTAWAAVMVVSLLPLLMVEWTKGLQVGKSYLPIFVGLLFLITMFMHEMDLFVRGSVLAVPFWLAVAAMIGGQAWWSYRAYASDILPARMAPTTLRKVLKKMGAKEFYTYDNPYNNPLVNTMLYSYPGEFVMRPIKTIAEVRDGVVVIPGTSSKSMQMETLSYAIANGDFNEDQALLRLYENRAIETIAAAKIPMFGCSRIYANESEITSYRDLILRQINDDDRWRAHAWVVEANAAGKRGNL